MRTHAKLSESLGEYSQESGCSLWVRVPVRNTYASEIVENAPEIGGNERPAHCRMSSTHHFERALTVPMGLVLQRSIDELARHGG
jgi:hypothetical protein